MFEEGINEGQSTPPHFFIPHLLFLLASHPTSFNWLLTFAHRALGSFPSYTFTLVDKELTGKIWLNCSEKELRGVNFFFFVVYY